MKKILCFGDSNTFGFNPENAGRYDKQNRWSGILSKILGNEYYIAEEGMNNRTAFFAYPAALKQSGGEYLPIYIKKHNDFDICIIQLGTNDAQISYQLDENVVRTGLRRMISAIRKANPKTKIILVPPVKITKDILHSEFRILFDTISMEKILRTFPVWEKFAKNNKCLYFDFNKIVTPCKIDGLHYTKESHQIIAEKLAEFILNIQ